MKAHIIRRPLEIQAAFIWEKIRGALEQNSKQENSCELRHEKWVSEFQSIGGAVPWQINQRHFNECWAIEN